MSNETWRVSPFGRFLGKKQGWLVSQGKDELDYDISMAVCWEKDVAERIAADHNAAEQVRVLREALERVAGLERQDWRLNSDDLAVVSAALALHPLRPDAAGARAVEPGLIDAVSPGLEACTADDTRPPDQGHRVE